MIFSYRREVRSKTRCEYITFLKIAQKIRFVDPSDLAVGELYSLNKDTPFMTELITDTLSDEQIITVINRRKKLHRGGRIKVTDKILHDSKIWYEVKAGNHHG